MKNSHNARHAFIMVLMYALANAAAPPVAYGFGVKHYVSISNATPKAPYTSWDWAATNIQDALDSCASYDLVIVTNGVYDAGGRIVASAGMVTNRVAITNGIAVRAFSSDPADTVIVGAPDMRGGAPSNGPAAVRCAYLGADCSLEGFTLRGGFSSTGTADAAYGGGAYCQSARLSNCVIVSCRAYNAGGGAYGGTFNGCQVISNLSLGSGGGVYGGNCFNSRIITNYAAGNGGGGWGGVYSNCEINCNNAPYSGGALFSATVYNSIISNNASWVNYGGALQGGSAYNCAIVGNRGVGSCGGVIEASCVNCIILDNVGVYGSVSYGSYTFRNCLIAGNRNSPCFWSSVKMVNCTVVSNRSGVFGSSAGVTNCIIYGNSPYDVPSLAVESNCYYSCIGSNSAGPTHVAGRFNLYGVSPGFRDPAAGDYHLGSGWSPCFNAGIIEPWMTNGVDLDGNRRIRNGKVDMGAYELYLKKGTLFKAR